MYALYRKDFIERQKRRGRHNIGSFMASLKEVCNYGTKMLYEGWDKHS